MARQIFGVLAILALGAWASFVAGPARAQDYEAGMAAYEAGDYARAVRIWDPLASAGDAIAQYSLGKIYEAGNIDLQRDYGRAVEWYRLAAAQGVAAAQNNLGLMYAQGRGVARDAGRAAELWSAAAKQNHPMAQFNLGLAYFRGLGVAEHKPEAEVWFRHAAELGLADAQYALGQIKFHGLNAEADRGEALAWYQLAAAQGHIKAREQAESLRREGVTPRMAALSGDGARGPDRLAPAAPAPAETVSAPKPNPPAPETALQVPPAPEPAKTPAPAKPARIKTQTARAEPPAATAASSGAGGRVKVWLFSARDEGEAIGYLRRVEARHGALLSGVDGSVVPVRSSGRKVLYRVVAGDFANWNAGRDWCRALRSDAPGTFCKVLPAPKRVN